MTTFVCLLATSPLQEIFSLMDVNANLHLSAKLTLVELLELLMECVLLIVILEVEDLSQMVATVLITLNAFQCIVLQQEFVFLLALNLLQVFSQMVASVKLQENVYQTIAQLQDIASHLVLILTPVWIME